MHGVDQNAMAEVPLRYLSSLGPHSVRLGLHRMERALADLGHPERRLHTLLVAGTNGKGSTCAMADKDYRGILRILASRVRAVHLCPALTPRSLAPAECAAAAAELGLPASSFPTCEAALAGAREAAGEQGMVCATGSLSVVAEVRRLLLDEPTVSDHEEQPPWM